MCQALELEKMRTSEAAGCRRWEPRQPPDFRDENSENIFGDAFRKRGERRTSPALEKRTLSMGEGEIDPFVSHIRDKPPETQGLSGASSLPDPECVRRSRTQTLRALDHSTHRNST